MIVLVVPIPNRKRLVASVYIVHHINGIAQQVRDDLPELDAVGAYQGRLAGEFGG